MAADLAVKLKNVSFAYISKKSRFKALLANLPFRLFSSRTSVDEVVLRDVSFTVKRRESIGILGRNGAGKSTLLSILAGVYEPTEGEVALAYEGNVIALLELGAGFDQASTGRENVILSAELLGLKINRKKLIEYCKEFSGLGDFFEKPVSTYSSGMFARLAFSVATAEAPTVLIVDEALSVGDMNFQRKCLNRIKEMRESGTALLLVSHDVNTIRQFCEKALWIENGKVKMFTNVEIVTSYFVKDMEQENFSVESKDVQSMDAPKFENKFTEFSTTNPFSRFGDCVGALKSFQISDEDNELVTTFLTGQKYNVKIAYELTKHVQNDVGISISFKDSSGKDMLVLSTLDSDLKYKIEPKGVVCFTFDSPFVADKYFAVAAIESRANGSGDITYHDYVDGFCQITAVNNYNHFGTIHVKAALTYEKV